MPWHTNLETRAVPSYKRSQKLSMVESGVIGNWATSGENSTAFTVTADRLYAIPLFLPDTVRVSHMTCEVTTASAGNIRMMLYTDGQFTGGTAGYPNAPLLTETEITTAGTTGIKKQVIGLTLPGGFYWGVTHFSSTPTVRTDLYNAGEHTWLGFPNMNDSTFNQTGIIVTDTYGALPNPFTAGAVLSSASSPRVCMVIGKYGVLP